MKLLRNKIKPADRALLGRPGCFFLRIQAIFPDIAGMFQLEGTLIKC
jgi:hypothetical protein